VPRDSPLIGFVCLHVCVWDLHINPIQVFICVCIGLRVQCVFSMISRFHLFERLHLFDRFHLFTRVCMGFIYGVATNSRLLKITGLFCKRALQKRLYSAKETYNFKEPTNRSHPMSVYRAERSVCIECD